MPLSPGSLAPEHDKRLRKNLRFIKENIDANDLTDYFIEEEIFDFPDVDEINGHNPNTIRSRNDCFIRLLFKSGSRANEVLLTALQKNGQQFIADRINGNTANPLDTKRAESNVVQQHLLDLYRTQCVWEDPLTSDEVFIPHMYVQPAVKVIKENDEYGVLKELPGRSTLTYQTLFYSQSRACRNVYISGDAGTGKTTFCNALVLHWCNAVLNIPDDTVSTEESDVLSSFTFLFYINLRNTETEYRVERMIEEQVLHNVPGSFNVADLLRDERCLVVLDGLDEWACPGGVKTCPDINKHIPGRNTANKNCVFLTTTRSWKYDVIELKSKDVDKHIELCGIDEDAFKELTQRMTEYLNTKSLCMKSVDDFYTDIKEKKLESFTSVPVLLIQLITLWHYGKDVGQSQVQLYCSMVDLLFEHSVKNISQVTSTLTGGDKATRKPLPDCFNTKEYCQKHSQLLHSLAKLAFASLFNTQREESLVFRSSRMEIFGISPSDVNLCLQCGVLSQNRDYRNYTGKFKRFSFIHKQLQEFLAAIYIVTLDDVQLILKDVKEFCNSLDTILEMSQVWLFIAGFRRDITEEILAHLALVVNSDSRVLHYRQALDGEELIRTIQAHVIDCVQEGEYNGHLYKTVFLEDFYIERDNVCRVKPLLIGSEGSQVKSVYVYTFNIDDDLLSALTTKIQHCGTLQKLNIYDTELRIPVHDVSSIVHNTCNTLSCLQLWRITATDDLISAICEGIYQCLSQLELLSVTLSHRNKERITNTLSQSPNIRELRLELFCTNKGHGYRCMPRLDVRTMTQLRVLDLHFMKLDNLQAVVPCVEKVQLWHVTIPLTAICEFAQEIARTSRAVEIELGDTDLTEHDDSPSDLNCFLRSIENIKLTNCEFSDSSNTWCVKFHTVNR